MTPAEEDALIESSLKATVQTNGTTFFVYSSKEAMRLAIRAAYAQGAAQERERCAKVCEEHEPKDYTTAGIMTRMICAAAIRRG